MIAPEGSLLAALQTGIGWLDMEQPAGAMQQHHGIHGGIQWSGRVSVGLCPRGWAARPVVVFKALAARYVGNGHWENPFTRNERARLALVIRQVAPVVKAWGGEDVDSYSIAIDHALHPALDGALRAYRAGCPDHPRHPLCGWAPEHGGQGCPWYSTGHTLMRYPEGWQG